MKKVTLSLDGWGRTPCQAMRQAMNMEAIRNVLEEANRDKYP